MKRFGKYSIKSVYAIWTSQTLCLEKLVFIVFTHVEVLYLNVCDVQLINNRACTFSFVKPFSRVRDFDVLNTYQNKNDVYHSPFILILKSFLMTFYGEFDCQLDIFIYCLREMQFFSFCLEYKYLYCILNNEICQNKIQQFIQEYV